jgi:hypothetical protein
MQKLKSTSSTANQKKVLALPPNKKGDFHPESNRGRPCTILNHTNYTIYFTLKSPISNMLMTNFFCIKNTFFSTLIRPIDPASQPYHATRLSASFRSASFSLGWVGPEKMTLISFSDPTPWSVLVPHRQCKECTRCQVWHFSCCEPIHLLHKNPACSYWRLELEQRIKDSRHRGVLVTFGASQSD